MMLATQTLVISLVNDILKKVIKFSIFWSNELHRGKQCLVVNCFPTAQLTSEVVGVLKFGWLTIAAIVISCS